MPTTPRAAAARGGLHAWFLWPRWLGGCAYLLLEGQEPVQVGLELVGAGLHL